MPCPCVGAGNPMLRTNARYGPCLHGAQSSEWEMDDCLAVLMQEGIHVPVGAWFGEGRCP